MDTKLIGLDPIIPDEPMVMILGSMPSVMSLENQEYYGNPRNHFWNILFEIFSRKPIFDYQKKIEFIKEKHIILWDVIGACYRKGSLDSAIIMEEPNDIGGVLENYPSVRLIACNGTKSFQTLKRNMDLNKMTSIKVIKLPSTSPIPGKYTKSFAGKVEEWKQIVKYL